MLGHNVLFAVIFSFIPFWAFAGPIDVLQDIEMAFKRDVGGIAIDSVYCEKVVREAEDTVRRSQAFRESQFFLLTDRNHKEQKAFLAFYDAAHAKIILIGADKISTGDPSRRGHFETPIGVFENKPANMSYRALGTKNKVGWRGLGAKGSRVWDLGWQRTVKARGEPMEIRMLVHASDPTFGEQRLGTVQSKGCVRISARFNRFLDSYGVLDRTYEESSKAKYVLLSNRNPIPLAGKFVVVIDSGEPALKAGFFFA